MENEIEIEIENEIEIYGKNTILIDDNDNDVFYIIVYGKIYFKNEMFYKKVNLKVRKMKWSICDSVIIPINNFKNKKYFFVDKYELTVDENDEIKKLDNRYIHRNNIITTAKKYVSMVDIKDREYNANNENYCKYDIKRLQHFTYFFPKI